MERHPTAVAKTEMRETSRSDRSQCRNEKEQDWFNRSHQNFGVFLTLLSTLMLCTAF